MIEIKSLRVSFPTNVNELSSSAEGRGDSGRWWCWGWDSSFLVVEGLRTNAVAAPIVRENVIMDITNFRTSVDLVRTSDVKPVKSIAVLQDSKNASIY